MRIEDACPASPRPRSPRRERPAPEIRAPGLLALLVGNPPGNRRAGWKRFCSARSSIRKPHAALARRAKRPEERLDFPTQGDIVHEILKEWWPRRPAAIAPASSAYSKSIASDRIPPGYHTERLRNSMLEDLEAFAADTTWPPGLKSRMEEPFSFALDTPEGIPGIEIAGKIDRLDTAEDGSAFVVDYKYSARARVKSKLDDERLLQAQLYGMAAERAFGLSLAGMFYVGLKREVSYVGWSSNGLLGKEPFPGGWFERARERTLAAVGQIREGRVAPHPADTDHCQWCDFRDACRVDLRAAAAEERAAGERV